MAGLGLDGEMGGGGGERRNAGVEPAKPARSTIWRVPMPYFPPPSSVENVVAPTQATTPDSS